MNTETEIESESQTTEVVPMGALESIERAQIDIQIATAKRYPRTYSLVKSKMLSLATLDEDTAAACFYTLPRGGKSIQGPSVRLAEIALSCYTNVRAATRVIAEVTDGPNPHVMIQSVCFDLENNVAVSIEKRRRITKKKSKSAPDEDDINLAVNAGAAIAFRDAVFKVVPGALIKPVLDAARKVAVGDVKSLVVQRGKVIDRLKQMGVTEDRILLAVECNKIEDIDLDKLGSLIGLGTAIKDGNTTVEEAFPFAPHPGTVPHAAQPVAGATNPVPPNKPSEKAPEKAPTPAAPSAPASNVVPMSTTAPAESLEDKEAREESERIAAEKKKADEAKVKAESEARAKTAQAANAALPEPSPDMVPKMREIITQNGITVGQLSQYASVMYKVPAFTKLDDFYQSAPKWFRNILCKHLTDPAKLAKMKTMPGADVKEA